MAEFNQNIINIYGEIGKTWLANLPSIIHHLAAKYNLKHLQPLNNLTHNYVMIGQQCLAFNTQDIILKLSPDITGLQREAAALSCFGEFNTPRILAIDNGMILLERIIPGHVLSIKYDNTIKIACTVMQQLHRNQLYNNADFPHIQAQLKILDHNWPIPKIYLAAARRLRDQSINQLFASSQSSILLHGDLHYGNILLGQNGWLVIDPKGIIGHPINEIWAFVMDMENDLIFIANFFKFELKFVRDWYFIHLIVVICQVLEDKGSPVMFMQLASKAYKLIH